MVVWGQPVLRARFRVHKSNNWQDKLITFAKQPDALMQSARTSSSCMCYMCNLVFTALPVFTSVGFMHIPGPKCLASFQAPSQKLLQGSPQFDLFIFDKHSYVEVPRWSICNNKLYMVVYPVYLVSCICYIPRISCMGPGPRTHAGYTIYIYIYIYILSPPHLGSNFT